VYNVYDKDHPAIGILTVVIVELDLCDYSAEGIPALDVFEHRNVIMLNPDPKVGEP
jgi:hypothetical protein